MRTKPDIWASAPERSGTAGRTAKGRARRTALGRSRALGTFVVLAAAGCGAGVRGTGAVDQHCTPTTAAPLGGFTCDEGLVCNTALPSTVCERSNTHAAGDPCSENDNCQTGLWCSSRVCKPLLAESEACGSPTACASGLECMKPEDGGMARREPRNGGAEDAARD